MMQSMIVRLAALLACLLLASAVAADTIYKYRRADGQTTYSNHPVRGLELIETFDYRFPDPPPPNRNAAKSNAEGETRIKQYLGTLDAAWRNVQDATRASALAEERLAAGTQAQDGDRAGTVADSAPPAVGGVPTAASPAIGGPMSGRRGRAAPEYVARVRALEADVAAARARLDEALRVYNQLR